MKRTALFCNLTILLALAWHPVAAQDNIPQTSGFSGFALVAPGYFSVASNRIVTGAPLLDDVGDEQIDSIFDAPSSNTAPALAVVGEISYTFASTRTQVFFGNRLEDILRLDVAFGLGVRQELPDGSILAGSLLTTPLNLKFWSDPYVEGEDRQQTELNYPGVRLRWGRILTTGLELTATARQYQIDNEDSGDWLIDQGRLDPDQQSSLDRNGNTLRVQALYRIDVRQKHRFEPAVILVNDDHDGAAVANKGYDLKLTYLYFSPKVVLDANLIYGQRKADETNPIYGETLDSDRYGAALNAIIPVKEFTNSRLSVLVGLEALNENANVDFYDSKLAAVQVGLIWRHVRP